jgi:hypothetical protein
MYLLGDRLFVVADADEGPVGGTLIGFDAKIIRKHKPATELFVRSVDGKAAVIAYTKTQGKQGLVHRVQAIDLVKGTRLAKRRGEIIVDADGRDRKLDFRPAYFLDDMTVAIGVKGGVWKKELDMRSPDSAATYNLLTTTWLRNEPIADVVSHARSLEVMTMSGRRAFVRTTADLQALEVWRDGVPAALHLDQPVAVYDASSITSIAKGDQLWMSLRVDPVNPPAVARQKADPEYLDLFEIRGDQAVRRARILAPKQKLQWGFAGEVLWVMEKNIGFDRGSKSVAFYRLK